MEHGSRLGYSMRGALALVACGCLALAMTATGAQASPTLQPRVINGNPSGALGAAVVSVQTDDEDCSGALWKPNVVVTAAHCVVLEDGSVVDADEFEVYPPGGRSDGAPTSAAVTDILVNPQYHHQVSSDADEETGLDAAFLVLDRAIGTPIVSRLATEVEAEALSMLRRPITITGYGQTQAGDAPSSPVPLSITLTAEDPSYEGGIGAIFLSVPRQAGPCFGDSGGPATATVGDLLLLVGTDSSGVGGACDPQGRESYEEITVTKGLSNLAAQALSRAGQPTEVVPTTCVDFTGSADTCEPGTAWVYERCWSTRSAVLQQRNNGRWRTIGPLAAERSERCDDDTPWLLSTAGFAKPGTVPMRAVAKGQSADQDSDDFTVRMS